jgi:DNA-binding transcriptional ArsR family regulator
MMAVNLRTMWCRGSTILQPRTTMARKKTLLLSVPEAARVFQLLGDPSRLRLLRLLTQRQEVCVGDMCSALRLPQSAASHHLMLLRRGQLVDYRRAGKQNFYRISSPLVPDLLQQVAAE